jgi:ribonuclease J
MLLKSAAVSDQAVMPHPKTNHRYPDNVTGADHLFIIPLGGVCEIGKNMTVYEQGDDILLVDCGLMFPGEELLGVDVVIPDISYLLANQDKIRGIVLTHGHEDHIGALPYVLAQLKAPLWGARLTMGFVRGKLEEYGLWEQTESHVVTAGETVRIGSFEVEFIQVSHSIPDALGVAIHTRLGTVIQTSDFKLDPTPLDGRPTDKEAFRRHGDAGVLALLCDTTNVLKVERTKSEVTLTPVFEEIFREAEGRVVVATFASNINRIQQVISVAESFGRKVALAGRRMEENIKLAREMGYVSFDEGTLVPLGMIDQQPPNQVCVLTTGSQGEPLSALARMATDEHKKISIDPGDTVILSSTPIPGNEDSVYRVINNLCRLGAHVVYSDETPGVHVSGHGSRDEVFEMIALTKPRFLVPAHGEYRHVAGFTREAMKGGYREDEIILSEVGSIIEFNGETAEVVGSVPSSGSVMVDGIGVGDVGEVVLRDRRHLADEGVVIVSLALNQATGEVIAGPDISSRGFVLETETDDLFDRAREIVLREIADIEPDFTGEWSVVKTDVRRALNKFFKAETDRRPMVLPVVIEV